MTRKGSIGNRTVGAILLLFAAAPLPAQSVSDYRLPEARPSEAATRAQGPVDAENPLSRQPVVRPSAAPIPAAAEPTPGPSPVPAVASPAAAASQPGRTTGPSPRRLPLPRAEGAPFSAPEPAPTTDTPAAESAPPTHAAPVEVAPESPALPDWLLPAMLGGLATALGFAAFLAWRRRQAGSPAIATSPPEPPRFEPPAPAPDRPAPLPPAPRPEPAPAPAPASASAPAAAAPLDIALEARRMTASLMATTLSYRITLSNRGKEPLAALAIEGDMVAAHASLPPEQQMATAAEPLALCHALVALAPGESAEFAGEFRLPLALITPIRAGDAALFVPLARLRIAASDGAGTPVIATQTFVVGEQPLTEGGGLRPFRLDLGPRTYAQIGQRAVN